MCFAAWIPAPGCVAHPRLSNAEIKDAWRYTKLHRMRDDTIADWLKITPEESELLERLPAAGASNPKPLRVSMASIRQTVADRREVIRLVIAEMGHVPDVRELADALNASGISGNHVTIWRDLRAIGFDWPRTRQARAEAARLVELNQPELLLEAG